MDSNSLSQIGLSLITKTPKGNIALRYSKELGKALEYILKEAKSLLKAEEGYLLLNTEDEKRIIIQTGKNKMPKVFESIVQAVFPHPYILKYRPGEKINLDEGKSVTASPANIISSAIGVDDGNFGVFLFSQKKDKDIFTDEDEELLHSFCLTLKTIFQYSTFTKDKKNILSDFLSTVTILLQKIYLSQKYKKSNYILEEVIHVSKIINSSENLDTLLLAIIKSAKEVLTAESSSLLLIDEESKEFYFNSVAGEKEEDLKKIRIPLDKGIAGVVAKSGKPLIINDAAQDERVYKTVDEQMKFTTRNLICAPLKVQNKIIGVIEVLNSIGRSQFMNSDLRLFSSFSDHAALAINNRDLIDNLQQAKGNLEKRVRELSTLLQISVIISLAKNEQDLFDKTVQVISDVLEIKRCTVLLYEERLQAFRLVSQFGLPPDISDQKEFPAENTISGMAYLSGKMIMESDIKKSKYLKYQRNGYITDSFMVAPLILNEKKLGVIAFSDKKDGSLFVKDDEGIINSVVNQVLKGYESIILHKEIIENETLKREVETSKKIQEAILPHTLPKITGLDLSALARPARETGGDYYDFFNIGENRIGIIIADVSGKSLPAALFMASTSSITRTLAPSLFSTNELLSKANDFVYQNSHSGMFVTLFYIIVDLNSYQIYFSSAGHNQQFLIKNNNELINLTAKGSPLGIMSSEKHGPFGMESMKVSKGDTLVLYTDGVIESFDSNKEEYGTDRMLAFINDNLSKSAEEIVYSVFNDVNKFAGSEPQFDDFTMVIAKIT